MKAINSAVPLDLSDESAAGEAGNVSEINTPQRPDSVALVTAIENAIEEVAAEKMTPIEVLGVLELVSKRFYEKHLQVGSI